MKDLAKAKADIYSMVKDIMSEAKIQEQQPALDIEALKNEDPTIFAMECLCYRIIDLAVDCEELLKQLEDKEEQ